MLQAVSMDDSCNSTQNFKVKQIFACSQRIYFKALIVLMGKLEFVVEKTSGCTSLMKIEANITCNKTYYDDMYSWICPSYRMHLRRTYYLCSEVAFKVYNLSLVMRKHKTHSHGRTLWYSCISITNDIMLSKARKHR